ncbi:hypothetical protein JCM5353_002084 [Sporobolomyces roseus]
MSTRLTTRLLRSTLPRSTPTRSHSIVPSRFLSTSKPSSPGYYPSLETPPKRGIKIGYVFSALALLGISATSYGLYQFYSSFTAYPDSTTHPIRSKLRAALRSEQSLEFSRASSFFQQAYDLALDLHRLGELGKSREEALIRLSGIAVRWAGMWEQQGELGKAIEVYDLGFIPIAEVVHDGEGSASVGEIKRGAGLAMKLGDLWVTLGASEVGVRGGEAQKEAERYYTWSVEELMRLSLTEEQKGKVKEKMQAQESGLPREEKLKEGREEEEEEGMKLPGWVGQVELVAAFERLGDLYSRQGRIELAQPLLQQAITTLYPPPKKDSTPQPPPPISRRCHAATLMNNLSSALVTAPSPSSSSIEASSRWARQALNVSNSCKREATKSRQGTEIPLRDREEVECELTAVVACYNLGKLAEMSKDSVSAEEWFVRSEKLALGLGLKDAVLQARESLRRLKHPTV